MRRISRIRSLVISAVLTTMAIPGCTEAPVPGTYWQKGACVQHPAAEVRVRWCVDAVTIAENGRMEFQCSWSLASMTALRGAEKGPDQGNRNMFITDQAGRRFDHVDTTGAARFGGQLKWIDAITGSFIFPAPPPGASAFTFHDDDQHVVIPNIRLDAASRTSKEDSRAVLGAALDATEVEISDARSGLGPSSFSPCVAPSEGPRFWSKWSPHGDVRIVSSHTFRGADPAWSVRSADRAHRRLPLRFDPREDERRRVAFS